MFAGSESGVDVDVLEKMEQMTRLVLATFVAAAALAAMGAKVDRGVGVFALPEIDSAIQAANNYLVQSVDANGRFEYRVDASFGLVADGYNWLRHAGAIYAMASACDESCVVSDRRAILRAIVYLQKSAIRPVAAADATAAVWSEDAKIGSESRAVAKLGGAGLALVAIATATDAVGTNPDIAQLEALGNFILMMQKPDGGFHSKYLPQRSGRFHKWSSLYYPGEAAFGLVKLFELTGAPQYLFAATDALRHLADSRSSASQVPADHWALIATRAIWPYLAEPDRERLANHARQIVSSILAEQINAPGSSCDGGFSIDGRITPTSTRIEGLLAAAHLFPDDSPFYETIVDAASHGIGFLMKNQISGGAYRGAFRRAVRALRSDEAGYTSTFNRRASEIRIDYVQHALSALLAWREIVASGKDKS